MEGSEICGYPTKEVFASRGPPEAQIGSEVLGGRRPPPPPPPRGGDGTAKVLDLFLLDQSSQERGLLLSTVVSRL